jgi:acyl-CoA thioesterase I
MPSVTISRLPGNCPKQASTGCLKIKTRMKKTFLKIRMALLTLAVLAGTAAAQPAAAQPAAAQTSAAQPAGYLGDIKLELQKKWPANRTINLVFHGHSVPAGYARTPDVNSFDSYPYLVQRELKRLYPYAVINIIVTAIGGENSSQGAQRFKKDVLTHRPDVLFIDYALNDRKIGLEPSRRNMEKMIRAALKKNIRVILLTPSADEQVNLLQPGNELELFARQITQLAEKYKIGLADSYSRFRRIEEQKMDIHEYMAQSNHPNRKGHGMIAEEILLYFR